jgi:arginyl-tRNA synthetase
MATLTQPGLETLLESIGLETPVPAFDSADALVKPVDIYRSYLADTAARLLECDRSVAFEAVQASNHKDNGDLTLILAKLGFKGKDIASDALKKVSVASYPELRVLLDGSVD